MKYLRAARHGVKRFRCGCTQLTCGVRSAPNRGAFAGPSGRSSADSGTGSGRGRVGLDYSTSPARREVISATESINCPTPPSFNTRAYSDRRNAISLTRPPE